MTTQGPIDFMLPDEEFKVLDKVIERAKDAGYENLGRLTMDLIATHKYCIPLDFEKLLNASESDFIHDITGITIHLDRTKVAMADYFVPRCAAKD